MRASLRIGAGTGRLVASLAIGLLVFARSASADDANAETFALSRSVDPNGLSFLRKTRLRTPTGFLYPLAFPVPRECFLERIGPDMV